MRPYLRVANVYEDRIDTSDVAEMNFTPAEFERYALTVGDVLLNEGQSLELVGRPALYRGEVEGACFQNTLVRFRAGKAVLPKFALLVFRSYLHNQRFQRIARWTTNIAHLGAERFAKLEFPVPPIPEQRRIVAALEERLSELDAAVAGLERARANAGRVALAIRNSVLRDLPTRALGELLAAPLTNGRSVPTASIGFPVLRLTCLKAGRVLLSERKIGDWTAADAAPYLVSEGEFLVSRGNGSRSLVGRGGLVGRVEHPVAFPDTLIRVRPDSTRLLPQFLRIVWESRVVRLQIEQVARTTAGIYKINQQDIERIQLALPDSLDRQEELVSVLDEQLGDVDRGLKAIDSQLARAARLRQSILKSAFEGTLLPQDPNDEPASVLLERIRAERKSSAATPKHSRRSAAVKSNC